MKKHIWICVIILLLPLFIFNIFIPEINKEQKRTLKTSLYPNNNIYNKFILGAMDEESGAVNKNYSATDLFEFNVSHNYNEGYWDSSLGFRRRYPKGRTLNDLTLSNSSEYKNEVTSYLNNVYSVHSERRSITQRPKIQWLCYGQSSTYEAEDLPATDDLWFYSYNRDSLSTGNEIIDDNKKVVFCRAENSKIPGNSVDKRGYICKRLKANTEQCNPADNFDGDVNCDWIVKPCIRIPVDFVKPSNDEVPVCKVTVIMQDGVTPKENSEFIIKAKYFRDPITGKYDGSYKERFNFSGEGDQKFHGNLGNMWNFRARGDWSRYDTASFNMADIRVEWLGNCDMWIDYVKVENDVADDLLDSVSVNSVHQKYMKWIEDEIKVIAFNNDPQSVPVILKYYIELTEYNNTPCMRFVNEKLKYYSTEFSNNAYSLDLMADFNPAFIFAHVSWNENFQMISSSEWIWKNYIDKIGFTQFFAESYPLTSVYDAAGTWSRIPSTLPVTKGKYVLADSVNPLSYDLWLQNELNSFPYIYESKEPVNNCPVNSCGNSPCEDKGNYRYIMKTGSELSRNHNIPFIFMPQAHLWYLPTEIRREPTNEELNMMANVAVSYGVKGLMWFWFRSGNGNAECGTYDYYSRGMVDVNGELLTTNVYGQAYPKWQVFRDISRRMKSWEDELLNFDNSYSRSFIYQDERDLFIANSFFKDLYSFKPNDGSNNCTNEFPQGIIMPPGYIGECRNERYLQVAKFKRIDRTNEYYFMVVNRRCSPYYENGDNGGRRLVKVQFNPASVELNGSDNWKITEIGSTSAPIEFNKINMPLVDLGIFLPGEGKLYKITHLN